MNELHLFAGAGGGILGGMLLGHTCVCAVEWEPHARKVLLARQRDGCLPRFPIWDDVQTFDGTPWRGRVDIVCGGFPCQDISAAGKGAGIDGARSGMWAHMARIAGEIRPRFVFVENSPMLTSRGLGRVLGDLAAMGYDAEWGVFGAHHAGAPHKRDRIWILAYARHMLRRDWAESVKKKSTAIARCGEMGYTECEGLERANAVSCAFDSTRQRKEMAPTPAPNVGGMPGASWWEVEPRLGRVADGVVDRVERLKRIGNGQVPAVAALAFQILSARLGSTH